MKEAGFKTMARGNSDMSLVEEIHEIYRTPVAIEKANEVLGQTDPIHAIRRGEDPFGEEFVDRYAFTREYGFVVPSVEMIELIDNLGPSVEVGAGTGYISRMLKDCIATDSMSGAYGFEYGEVEKLPAIEAAEKYADRAVVCMWPCYDEPWAYELLKTLEPGRLLVYVGEGMGGCTGDENFHRHLYEHCREVAELAIPRWYGMRDYLMVYEVNVK